MMRFVIHEEVMPFTHIIIAGTTEHLHLAHWIQFADDGAEIGVDIRFLSCVRTYNIFTSCWYWCRTFLVNGGYWTAFIGTASVEEFP